MTPLTPPRERFFLNFPFFPRRVITSLSVRQLRRKKSSNNHIYGAAASLRCIDPRRWPRGGRRAGGKRGKSPSVEAKWKEKRKTEEAREKEGKGRKKDRKHSAKRAPTFCWNRSACAPRRCRDFSGHGARGKNAAPLDKTTAFATTRKSMPVCLDIDGRDRNLYLASRARARVTTFQIQPSFIATTSTARISIREKEGERGRSLTLKNGIIKFLLARAIRDYL